MEPITTLQTKSAKAPSAVAVTDIMPSIRKLSNTDKLMLIQMIAQEIAEASVVEVGEAPTEIEEEEDADDFSLAERIEFFKKPPEEQNKILAAQAEAMLPYYEQNTEWKEWLAGDIVEY